MSQMKRKSNEVDTNRASTRFFFTGFIESKKDLCLPKNFGWEEVFSVVIFTDIDNENQKKKIVGKIPLIQKNVYYKMFIQLLNHPKHGPSWTIVSCEIIPPFKNIKNSMLHFIRLFSTKGLTDEIDIKQMKYKVEKEYKKVREKISSSNNLHWSWIEFMRPLIVKDKISEGFLSKDSEQAPSKMSETLVRKLYPKIISTYAEISSSNWWHTLSDQVKDLWEQQLQTPRLSFCMCFRQSMPIELRYLVDKEYTNDHLDIDMGVIPTGYSNSIKHRYDYLDYTGTDSKKQEKVNNTDNQQLLKQKLRECNYIEMFQRKNKNTTNYRYIPEMSLESFKKLCFISGWVETKISEIDILNGLGVRQFGHKTIELLYVTELEKYFNAIGAYRSFDSIISKSNECSVSFKEILVKFQSGIQTLIDYKVLSFVGHHNEQRIIHHWWKKCKKLFLKVISRENVDDIKMITTKVDDAITWDDEQKKVVDLVLSNKSVIVYGAAGTGKSNVIKLLDQTFPGKCCVVSYTGKAVEEVASRLSHSETSTIHKKIRNCQNGGDHCDILIIDECSMVTELLIMKLIACVKFKRIVFVGDSQQIPCWGFCKGYFFEQLIKRGITKLELTKNYRQLKDPNNLILYNAFSVLEEKPLKFDQLTFRSRPSEAGLNQLIAQFSPTKFKEMTFITALIIDSNHVNQKCVESLNKNLKFSSQSQALNTFTVGDRIMVNQRVDRTTDDDLDAYFNQKYYTQTDQVKESRPRNLMLNGQMDVIEEILIVPDSKLLLRYYNKQYNSFRYANTSSEEFNVFIHAPSIDGLIVSVKNVTRKLYSTLQDVHNSNNDNMLFIKLLSGRVCKLSDAFQHGFATTVYKLQGSSQQNIALYLPNYSTNEYLKEEFGRNHLYTSITRAIQSFTFLGEGPSALNSMKSTITKINCDLSQC